VGRWRGLTVRALRGAPSRAAAARLTSPPAEGQPQQGRNGRDLASHPTLGDEELALIRQVQWGEDCSDEDVEELRAIVARLQPTT